MRLHVFLALVANLQLCGLTDSRDVTLQEQVAIFLYTCVTGLSIQHVGERFQHSNETISKYVYIFHFSQHVNIACRYFWKILIAVSSFITPSPSRHILDTLDNPKGSSELEKSVNTQLYNGNMVTYTVPLVLTCLDSFQPSLCH